ncbi:hypothetical protein PR202_gb17571 [Eleusine coracana subsp. coracana]|uniref:Uncharacterized protein n=1 Tax=Eleusine coracana subsp. coracana TaxID=191504 RepID=A0AAV5F4M0_ELECO|nr:hypothetical protein PR202_gb17571 [Eleusine coracana subsp. coracana]
MASSGYYSSPYQYQPAPYYYDHSPQQRASSVLVFLFLATMSLLAASTLIALWESAVEVLTHQLRGFVILSPVLVVIAVQLWVSSGGGGGLESLFQELATEDQREQFYYPYYRHHGGGSSPWGVVVALALVLSLVTYKSSIHERWFWPVTAAFFTVVIVVHGRRAKIS